MGMTYADMMAKVNASKGTVTKARIGISHKWNYDEPYKMICLDFKETDNGKMDVTYGFKVNGEFVEFTRGYPIEGKAAYYWDQFINSAFPYASDDVTLDMLLGRPFSAEIVKNDGFNNIKVLSGYKGDFPDEMEGLE